MLISFYSRYLLFITTLPPPKLVSGSNCSIWKLSLILSWQKEVALSVITRASLWKPESKNANGGVFVVVRRVSTIFKGYLGWKPIRAINDCLPKKLILSIKRGDLNAFSSAVPSDCPFLVAAIFFKRKVCWELWRQCMVVLSTLDENVFNMQQSTQRSVAILALTVWT